jgi:hypothetical protein
VVKSKHKKRQGDITVVSIIDKNMNIMSLFVCSSIAGLKQYNYSNPQMLLVHPFVLYVNFHLSSMSSEIWPLDSHSPLNITKQGIALPAIETHSTIDIHFECPDIDCNFVFISLLIIMFEDYAVPIENPVSSIL